MSLDFHINLEEPVCVNPNYRYEGHWLFTWVLIAVSEVSFESVFQEIWNISFLNWSLVCGFDYQSSILKFIGKGYTRTDLWLFFREYSLIWGLCRSLQKSKFMLFLSDRFQFSSSKNKFAIHIQCVEQTVKNIMHFQKSHFCLEFLFFLVFVQWDIPARNFEYYFLYWLPMDSFSFLTSIISLNKCNLANIRPYSAIACK